MSTSSHRRLWSSTRRRMPPPHGAYSITGTAMSAVCYLFCFFFQAEDGIRDLIVTGVQTCALPIWNDALRESSPPPAGRREVVVPGEVEASRGRDLGVVDLDLVGLGPGCAAARQHAGHQRRASSNRMCAIHHRSFKCALSVTIFDRLSGLWPDGSAGYNPALIKRALKTSS